MAMSSPSRAPRGKIELRPGAKGAKSNFDSQFSGLAEAGRHLVDGAVLDKTGLKIWRWLCGRGVLLAQMLNSRGWASALTIRLLGVGPNPDFPWRGQPQKKSRARAPFRYPGNIKGKLTPPTRPEVMTAATYCTVRLSHTDETFSCSTRHACFGLIYAWMTSAISNL